jgi:hypothetical protein
MLTLVCLETVKGIVMGGDMQAVPDKDAFTIERDDGQACAKDWGKGVVLHANVAARDRVIGYTCRFVGNHVIRCARVSNHKTRARPELVGDECNRMHRRVVGKG